MPKIYSPKTDTDLKPKVSKTLSSTERTLNLRPNYSSNSTVSKNTSFEKNQSQSTTLPIFEFRPNYSNTPPQKSTNFKTNKNYSNVGNNIPKSSFHKSEPLPPPISDHLSVNNRGGTSEPSLFNSNKKPSSNQFSSSAPMHANERDIKCYGTVSVIKSGGFGFIKEDSLQQDIFFKLSKNVALCVGDKVEFTKTIDNIKGGGASKAINVCLVGSKGKDDFDVNNTQSIYKWLEFQESNQYSNPLSITIQKTKIELLLATKMDVKIIQKFTQIVTNTEFMRSDRDRTDSIYRAIIDSNFMKNPDNLSAYIIKLGHNKSKADQTPGILRDENMKQVLQLMDTLLDRFPQEYVKLPFDSMEKAFKNNKLINEGLKGAFEVICKKKQTAHQNITKFVTNSNNQRSEDIKDFRSITIFPNSAEILQDPGPLNQRLRKNIIEGKYDNVLHYLDIHFRLLREDCISSIRQGIQQYRNDPNFVSVDVSVYKNVKVEGVQCSVDGIVFRISFDLDVEVNWACSSRLMYGSLICLSPDNFETLYWACVSVRDTDLLTKKQQVDIRFPEGFVEMFADVNSGVTYTMVESTSTYFEAYKHVLWALQNVSINEFPFVKHLIKLEPNVKPPSYLTTSNQTYKFVNIFDNEISVNALLKWPEVETGVSDGDKDRNTNKIKTSMDASQLDAFKRALCCEFAIIQGPPGTGKTFVGLKVVRALLSNFELMKKNAPGPILVICFTNHALDQFLEGILDFEENIVRIGGRSQSVKLKEKNLNTLLYETDTATEHKKARKQQIDKMKELELELSECFNCLKKLILTQEDIEELAYSEHQLQSLYSRHRLEDIHNVIYDWLGASSNHDRIKDILTSNKKSEAQKRPLKRESNDSLEDEEIILQTQNERMVGEDTTKYETYQLDDVIVSFDEIHKLSDSIIEAYDVWELSPVERVKLYKYWLKRYRDEMSRNLKGLCKVYDNATKEKIDSENQMKIAVLSEAKVIGMTTTGAAKFNKVIQKVRAPIIIVEEAAEVLESHIVSALTSSTKHLILIGDHEQLRPKTVVYELTKDFRMDVSLFERMVKNGVEHTTLSRQRRMRPEISKTMNVIYPQLTNHPHVETYPPVPGMKHNLYFVHHQNHETQQGSLSKSNAFEANFVAELCKYLMKQGFLPSRITILTAYGGQVKLIRSELTKIENSLHWQDFLLENPEMHINKVYVTSVDNYQGEENDIVLLSLVRSNKNGIIGFLDTSNRICVALSRAKHGMYIIGDGTMLKKKNKWWSKIIEVLEKKDNKETHYGKCLTLSCQNHKETETQISDVSDFKKVPDGGCQKKCEYILPCGHQCRYKCHPFPHDQVVCKSKMSTCRPCGHSVENHFCYEDIGNCEVEVYRELPCKHKILLPCYIEDYETKVCKHPCQRYLPCGHRCTQFCGEKCNKICTEAVEKPLVCGHIVDAECHSNTVNIVCGLCK